MSRGRLGPSLAVAVVLLPTYAYFWQSRDWNSSSRLMLTYALVDRQTIRLDGLEVQTGDIARFENHYYTDKLPGFSFLAVPIYATAKAAYGWPDHPRGRPALTHWPADYWVSLGVSGLATVVAAVVLVSIAAGLGCGPRASVLVGLSYGLATPAFAYATMSYGHQVTAAALIGAFALIRSERPGRQRLRWFAAGLLAALASTVELQVGPVSAVLGALAIAKAASGGGRWSSVAWFAIGAAGPSLALLSYNQLAFGSPWDMGYFHHATKQFARVHSTDNPLGLGRPDWSKLRPLLVGGYRGLLFYAPIVALAPFGWFALGLRRRWLELFGSLAAVLAVLAVNLSYPEWTGGWSTGPRLLVPLLPFAMVAVAGLLAVGDRPALVAGVVLAMAGAVLMLLFVGAGARFPQDVADPLRQMVLPAWGARGSGPGSAWARNLGAIASPEWVGGLGPGLGWLQFAPLVGYQAVAIGLAWWWLGRGRADSGGVAGAGAIEPRADG